MSRPHPLPVEIVGGGLAGLALALALRRAEVPVTVFEASHYPRHRVCGEFISGVDAASLDALAMGPFMLDAVPHRTVIYHHRQRPLPPFSLPATAFGISRHTLDARLARAFEAAGGDLRAGTRVEEDPAPEGRVFTTGRKTHGQFWVGLKVHVEDLTLASDLEVHLGERAYIGLSRVETGVVNVCGMFANRGLPERGIDLLPSYLRAAGLGGLAERLLGARMNPDSFCVSAATLGDRRVSPPDRIRVGDACAAIPAFTGNGLSMALQGAALAVEPLRAYSQGRMPWERVVRSIGVSQNRRFRRRLAAAALLQPFFLEPRRQALLAGLFSTGLVPIRAFYGALR